MNFPWCRNSFATGLCALAGAAGLLLLGGCSPADSGRLNGYVEIEPVRVAAPLAGYLQSLAVTRGSEVSSGQALFRLEQASERAAVDEAQARLQQAQAQVQPAAGKAAVLAAQMQAARAELRQAEADLKRQQQLAARGFTAGSSIDAFLSRRDTAAARVSEIAAQQRAADAGTGVASAQLAQSRWKLDNKQQLAPVSGRVDDTYYRVGEWVPAGSPVVSLLPPQGIKIRFYVPEAQLARVPAGSAVAVHCDGCGAAIAATVSYVASSAEFTPPVIYSRENRARLVFLVEARPALEQASRLHPGQPVEIELRSGEPGTAK